MFPFGYCRVFNDGPRKFLSMDKLFVFFLAIVLVVAAYAMYAGIGDVAEPTHETTSTIPSSPDTSSAAVSSTTTTTTSSTTSTVPRYVEVDVFYVEDCKNTVIGRMNNILVNVSGSNVNGTWGPEPNPTFYFSCDGDELMEFDRVLVRGGLSIKPGSSVDGLYRLSEKCGRTKKLKDFDSCSDLHVFIDLAYFDVSSINSSEVTQTSWDIPTTTTSTILSDNPYLDKFRGMGYRKLDMHVAWICPTCVPSVNKLVREQEGVKSRSLSYGQEVSYVIYDPILVSQDQILRLINAGATATVLNDTEI